MMLLLLVVLGVYAAYAVYIGVLSGRRTARADDFLDAGGNLPGWTPIFASVGVVIGGLGLPDHLRLVALFGLQYNHVALGLVVVALAAALAQKRLWLASRLTRTRSPVELLGAYYESVGLRVLLLMLVVLFAVPFAAGSLSQLGDLLAAATGGVAGRNASIWASAFFLFLSATLGGWRGAIYAIAAQSFLLLILLLFLGGFAAAEFWTFARPIGVPAGVVADRIPGVMQYTRGLGKDVAIGGPWTTTAILSFAVSLIGLVVSPGFGFLSMTTTSRSGVAISQTWMIAALGGGALLLAGPLFAVGMEHSLANLIDRLRALDGFVAILFVVMLAASLHIAVGFFTTSGAHVLTLDLVTRYLLPSLSPDGRRLALRITLAVAFGAVALTASAAPLPAALLGTATLSLSAQLLPAFLGLCWIPWISRGAVMSGLVVGVILVVFTEPPGLVLFEGLVLPLPWGRWPLTIHSAVWGLAFNVAACLLVSIFTRDGAERLHRETLHRTFAAESAGNLGGMAARWSLILIWAFLGLGPGAILGNDFFSRPIFTEGETTLGAPSLLLWQIVFWFAGVLLVWWMAYPTRLSVIDRPVVRTIDLAPPISVLAGPRRPAWIARGLDRLTQRAPPRRDRKTT